MASEVKERPRLGRVSANDRLVPERFAVKGLVGEILTPKTKGHDNKEVFIFVHGFAAHKNLFYEMAQNFATDGHICVLYDLRGHGESAGYDINTSKNISDLLRILNYVNQSIATSNVSGVRFIAHSYGCMISYGAEEQIMKLKERGKDYAFLDTPLYETIALGPQLSLQKGADDFRYFLHVAKILYEDRLFSFSLFSKFLLKLGKTSSKDTKFEIIVNYLYNKINYLKELTNTPTSKLLETVNYGITPASREGKEIELVIARLIRWTFIKTLIGLTNFRYKWMLDKDIRTKIKREENGNLFGMVGYSKVHDPHRYVSALLLESSLKSRVDTLKKRGRRVLPGIVGLGDGILHSETGKLSKSAIKEYRELYGSDWNPTPGMSHTSKTRQSELTMEASIRQLLQNEQSLGSTVSSIRTTQSVEEKEMNDVNPLTAELKKVNQTTAYA